MHPRLLTVMLVLLSIGFARPAEAAPVIDCPNRSAPFSADSPLLDILLSEPATAIVRGAAPEVFTEAAWVTSQTQVPAFSTIVTLRQISDNSGVDRARLEELEGLLRALPVTEEDMAARCARYDDDEPQFVLPEGMRPRVLVFEKINGFEDKPSVEAAHAAFEAMAERKGWAITFTDKGGAINPRALALFDVIIWNNVSGDVLTLSQREAFKTWLEGGGAYVGVHGSAGDPVYFWDWYPDGLVGARFAGHPGDPQFQEARIAVDPGHALAMTLPAEWRMTDEWYSFRGNPRAAGARVVLTLDENSYDPRTPGLAMGEDHPLAWTNCIGRGRMFYSAIGHLPQSYSEPNHVALLEAAIEWAATQDAC